MINCPYCTSNYIIKNGSIKRRRGSVQRYKCNSCGKRYIDKEIGSKHFKSEVILGAITLHNQGNTLEEASKIISKKFHVKIYPQLISSWLVQYAKLCGYKKIRGRGVTENPIIKRELYHKQTYEFAYHKIKVEKFINDYFKSLRYFLESAYKVCPNFLFKEDSIRGSGSSSQINIQIKPEVKKMTNSAVLLSKMVLRGNKDNKKRHEEIQNFMLVNDSSTLAVEVPVWLRPYETKALRQIFKAYKPITGHIDILQQRYGLIHILDYKPNADKESPISQLFCYALALSKRTNIWLRNFKCAWFNDEAYYEFNPAEIIIKNANLSRAEMPKYILNRDRQLFQEKRMYREDGVQTKKEILNTQRII